MTNQKPRRIRMFGSQATAVVSVALALAVLGVLALMSIAGYRASERLHDNAVITIQLKPEASDQGINRIKHSLATNRAVSKWHMTSADSVLAQEIKYIGKDVADLIEENPFGAEFEVRMARTHAHPDSMARFIAAVRTDTVVDRVAGDVNVARNVAQSTNRLAMSMAAVGGVLLLISLVLVANTVSLSIYSKRFIIRTMKLVGATPGFIRRPFVKAGAVNGVIAGVGASVMLAGLQAWLCSAEPSAAELLTWPDALCVYGGLLVIGALLCSTAAWISATRYLHRNYDALYRR